MSFVHSLFKQNFLEYASYVIKERAIPDVSDGLKPVHRRILHSLFEIDDGKFHKVANVVGHCMKYHPHGDMSIYEALVHLANSGLFIERQGNFGNRLTGDEPSAARYIECRVHPFARKVLYNPQQTVFVDSYDGRNREPLTFPAKIPVILAQGAEGIAVGMSTKVLPHNLGEILQAMKSSILGEPFYLYPDFIGGGMIDVSEYEDGLGRVHVRVQLNTKDPKRIIIEEIPFGTTTEKLIASIEAAAKKGKFKLASINDYTSEKIQIELHLARNTYTQDVVDALYAFTDCEQTIQVNLLVIHNNTPVRMTVTEVIDFHAKKLIEILKRELELESQELKERLHARTLERIFVEDRIYKEIEEMKSQEAIYQAVFTGFKPYRQEFTRDVTDDDVQRLLKIPIRRISRYDINKYKDEIKAIHARLEEIGYHLNHLQEYTLDYIDGLIKDTKKISQERKTKIVSFERVDVREAVGRDIDLCYDNGSGYIGTHVKNGGRLFHVSPYDRVLIVRRDGTFFVIPVPEKHFVGKGMLFCCIAEREILEKYIFSVLYQDKNKHIFIKRTKITQFMTNKQYDLLPKGCKLLKLTTKRNAGFHITYKPKPRLRILEETFAVSNYLVKGIRASGTRITNKEVKSVRLVSAGKPASNKDGGADHG